MNLIRKIWIMAVLFMLVSCNVFNNDPVINVWHGLNQKVGHLGDAQTDFNLMGTVNGLDSITSLTYWLNGYSGGKLTIGRGNYGFKRLARNGQFNVDVPINELEYGVNTITLTATDIHGVTTLIDVNVEKKTGSYPLPVHIDWSKVKDAQDVGQYVDGEWKIEKGALRTAHSGYDRIFLIGNKSWKEYEVSTSVTINNIDQPNKKNNFKNGVGLLMRFTGHVNGGYRKFAFGQPKHGYQPFGAIGWLRWKRGGQKENPQIQFYAGFSDKEINYSDFPIAPKQTYQMKMRCETLKEVPMGKIIMEEQIERKDGVKIDLPKLPISEQDITQYSFKIWDSNAEEPPDWIFQITQVSRNALQNGAFALLAHHIDASFGNISVTAILESNN